MESLAVAVPKKKAEQIKRKLVERGALRTDLQVASDAKMVYFPIRKHLDMGYELINRSFKELKQSPSDYRELVELPDDLKAKLPSSLDIIGHVALVKLSEELLDYGKDIGKAIARVNKPVSTVCLDTGVAGEERARNLKILYGSRETLTLYKEHGLSFKVDPRTMFFSPRLATERKIVAEQIGPGEIVFDMFAGVGPFSILIAKTRSPEMVYSADINNSAYELLKENIMRNKVEGKVRPFVGDVREISSEVPEAHRIIMNLPHSAFDFLDLAAKKLSDYGTIHYYHILQEEEVEGHLDEIKGRLSTSNRFIKESSVRKVKSYSSVLIYYAFDMKLV